MTPPPEYAIIYYMKDGTKPIELTVVEDCKYDKDHVAICAVESPKHVWHHFMVLDTQASPCRVSFGDHLVFTKETYKLRLRRGPTLEYNVHIDEYPEALMERTLASTLYSDFPGHELSFWGVESE